MLWMRRGVAKVKKERKAPAPRMMAALAWEEKESSTGWQASPMQEVVSENPLTWKCVSFWIRSQSSPTTYQLNLGWEDSIVDFTIWIRGLLVTKPVEQANISNDCLVFTVHRNPAMCRKHLLSADVVGSASSANFLVALPGTTISPSFEEAAVHWPRAKPRNIVVINYWKDEENEEAVQQQGLFVVQYPFACGHCRPWNKQSPGPRTHKKVEWGSLNIELQLCMVQRQEESK